MRRTAAIVGAALLGGLVAGVAAADPAPRRVVSLNPCMDAILLDVADPSQIAALSHYSTSPRQSAIAARSARFPHTWGSAEEVAALKPDLVLTSGMGAMALSGVLPRLKVRAASFVVPTSVDESLAQVEEVARLVGHPDRGAALAARIRTALADAAPHAGEPRLGALIYEYHGLASGPGTLVNELMRRTGFDNRATHYGLKRSGDVPLDALLADPPQVLLSGRMAPDEPTWADRVLGHPALKALAGRVRVETFPNS